MHNVSFCCLSSHIQLINFKRSTKCRLKRSLKSLAIHLWKQMLWKMALWEIYGAIKSNLLQTFLHKINLPWIYDFLQMLLNVRCDKLDCCYFICEAHMKINESKRFASRDFYCNSRQPSDEALADMNNCNLVIHSSDDMLKLLWNLRATLTVWWSVGDRESRFEWNLKPRVEKHWRIPPPPFIGSKSGFGRKLKHDRLVKLVNFSTLGIAFPQTLSLFS